MWTLETYNALFDYQDSSKRDGARAILNGAGLAQRVVELDGAKTLMTWYDMVKEAHAALSPIEIKRDRLSLGLSSKRGDW